MINDSELGISLSKMVFHDSESTESLNTNVTTRFIDYFFICGLPESSDIKLYKIHDDSTAGTVMFCVEM